MTRPRVIRHYKNKKLHNDTGPAVIYPNGRQEWWVDGKIHRDDGPAIIQSDGTFSWIFLHTKYTFDEWCDKLNKTDEEKVMLKLKYI